MPPRFHDLTVTSVRHDTEDAVVVGFAIPGPLADAYRFEPGQYLTLRATIGGEEVRRSYSICSPVGADTVEVGIRRIEGGAFSGFAQGLEPGAILSVMTPQGQFTAPLGGRHRYLLVAAGSGITPMMSIARSVLASEPESLVTLLYANRSTVSVMFREALEELKDRYLTRFRVTHVMDEEAQHVELLNGRLDREKLETMATRGVIAPAEADAIYICGPAPMMEAAEAAFLAMGVPAERLRLERFAPQGTPPVAGSQRRTGSGARVEVVLDGARRSFTLDAGLSVIEGAAAAGIDLPWSCANGMCATCRCRLAEGKAEMVQNFSLQEWEQAAGFILACQARPISDRIVLDFDAV